VRRDELRAGLIRLALLVAVGLVAISALAIVLVLAGGAEVRSAFGAGFGGAAVLLLLGGAAVGLGTGQTRGEWVGGVRVPRRTTPEERRESSLLAGGLLAAGVVCFIVALVLG
jgi:hypothetical protein